MLFIVFFESLALQRLLLAKHQPQHKYNEVRSSYGDILLSIADFRIAGKEISGSSRNVNKQDRKSTRLNSSHSTSSRMPSSA